MLFTMLEMTIKYTILIFILLQFILLSWHTIDLILKTRKISDWKFLILIAGFLLFNCTTLYALFMPGVIYLPLQLLLLNGSGIVLSVYYAVYLSIKYTKKEENLKGKYILTTLIGTYLIGAFIGNNFGIKSEIIRYLILITLIILAISFCFSIEKKIKSLYDSDVIKGKKVFLYSSYLTIVLMTANPLISVSTGYHEINVFLINILFLVTVGTYLYQIRLEERQVIHALERIGFYTDPRSIFAYKLSERELEVALMMLKDTPLSIIADELNIAKHTITKHASNIYKKTKTENIEHFKQKFVLSESTRK